MKWPYCHCGCVASLILHTSVFRGLEYWNSNFSKHSVCFDKTIFDDARQLLQQIRWRVNLEQIRMVPRSQKPNVNTSVQNCRGAVVVDCSLPLPILEELIFSQLSCDSVRLCDRCRWNFGRPAARSWIQRHHFEPHPLITRGAVARESKMQFYSVGIHSRKAQSWIDPPWMHGEILAYILLGRRRRNAWADMNY